MTIIRQGSLFDLQELYDLEPTQRFEAIFSAIDIWGVKKNSEDKNAFWYGYKAHLAVGTTIQYILQSLFSSGNLNDGKSAIPLLKGIHENVPIPTLRYETIDDGYDFEPIYTQIHRIGHQSVIAYNERNELESSGFDKHFAPTCAREHSYRYDSL
jgi:transposase